MKPRVLGAVVVRDAIAPVADYSPAAAPTAQDLGRLLQRRRRDSTAAEDQPPPAPSDAARLLARRRTAQRELDS